MNRSQTALLHAKEPQDAAFCASPVLPTTQLAENRLQAGEQAQIDIFGEGMRGFSQSGPEESRHINKWLSDNCFGDY